VITDAAAIFAYIASHWDYLTLGTAAVCGVIWLVTGQMLRNDAKRVQSGQMNALAAALASGEKVLGWIESERPAPDPARRVLSELRLAEAVWQWNELTKRAVEVALDPPAVAQFESRAGLKPPRPLPATVPDNLANYWESVAWRLEWLNDRMNRLRVPSRPRARPCVLARRQRGP
jgi:hypothetical protein